MFEYMTRHVAAPLVLRLGLAVIFIYHGLHMIGAETSWGSNWQLTETGEASPNAQPAIVQLAVAYGELLGGIALGLGFFSRVAALGIIAIMAGAIALVHWPHGFNIVHGGYEYNFAIIMMCLGVILLGPGPASFDRFMFPPRRRL